MLIIIFMGILLSNFIDFTPLNNNTINTSGTNLPCSATSSLNYSTRLGDYDWDEGMDLAVDIEGNIYFTGYTWTPTPGFPVTVGAYQTTKKGNFDAYVGKIEPEYG